jgi:superfamily II DNA or RNA helicase
MTLVQLPTTVSEIRDYMVNEIKNNILGPRSNDEKIPFNPKDEYFAGILFPNNWELDNEDKESDGNDSGDNDSGTSQISKDKLYKQSSFGLTCFIKKETKKINAKILFGKYAVSEEEFHYQRTHYEETFLIDTTITEGTHNFVNDPKFYIQYKIHEKSDSLLLELYVINNHKIQSKNSFKELMFQPELILRSLDSDYCFVQDHKEIDNFLDTNEDKHMKLLFDDRISFGRGHLCAVTWNDDNIKDRCINEISTTFLPIEKNILIKPNEEKKDYLNMNKIANCNSVQELRAILLPLVSDYEDWITKLEIEKLQNISSQYHDSAKIKISEIRKEIIPRIHEGIESVTSESDPNAFDSFKFANLAIAWQQTMGKWAETNIKFDDQINQLKYGKSQIEKNRKTTDEEKQSAIDQIDLQIKNLKNEKTSHPEPRSPSDDVNWRLFQIAFILLNLESIVNPKSNYRETVDLLWFPTGGGKTEAYLGLVAFTIAFRRLNGKIGDELSDKSLGVTVLMRYTLRLLTVQQFQRAALLMCACEKIRRGDQYKWGTDNPFQVGLWVGGAVTPNKREEGPSSAQNQKYSIRDRGTKITSIQGNNPYPLINCPWCGNALHERNGDTTGTPRQWRLFCSRTGCMFSKKDDKNSVDNSLPVVITDEDVYSRCPSLLISTVDKFAAISWTPNCKSIFGKVENYCRYCGYYQKNSKLKHTHPKEPNKPKNYLEERPPMSPPELIIQDELHLISGQLGTTFGLYETGLEYLMTSENGIKPKIIASTATTRAADDQIKNLFNRNKTSIFPPQVITFGDTFFSEIKTDDDTKKLYLGVLATNKSGLTVQAKISATILFNIKKLIEFGVPESYLDPYYTLVSYYNSQKDLGASGTSFKDSVPKFISVVQNQTFGHDFCSSTNPSQPIDKITLDPKLEQKLNNRFSNLITQELTSRRPSGEIPEILRELNQQSNETKYPVDLLLATNMLSVGVDIPRLGVMLVNGQPKKHSEYIQATGRIGRTKPGLIITLYSYTKPRDISQYEDFISYHSKFYQHVEKVSVTPFTLPSREMGLFGILVGLMRLKLQKLSTNNSAEKFDPEDETQKTIIAQIQKLFQDRVANIDPVESQNTQIRITELFEQWKLYTRIHKGFLKYQDNSYENRDKTKSSEYNYLLRDDLRSPNQLISVPRSFRDAEIELNLFYEKMDVSHE